MLIRSIEFTNFMPFLGQQTIELCQGSKNVTVVHAQNEHGKSSIANGIRWVLHNEARDRQNRRIPDHDLLNWTAAEREELSFGVKIHATAVLDSSTDTQQIDLEIHRECKGVKQQGGAVKFEPSTLTVYDESNGTRSDGVIPALVANLLPIEVIRFFLFDGEMLSEYETLLSDETSTAQEKVRRAIESVLGLPTLKYTRADLEHANTEVGKEIRKVERQDAANQEIINKTIAIEAKIASLETDHATLSEHEIQTEADLADVEDAMEQVGSIQDAIVEIKIKRGDLVKIRTSLADLAAERQEITADLWRDMLAATLEKKIESLTAELTVEQSKHNKILELQGDLDDLKTSISHANCVSCGQDMPSDLIERLKNKSMALEGEIKKVNVGYSPDRAQHIQHSIGVFHKIAPAGVQLALKLCEKNIRKTTVEEFNVQEKIASLEDVLTGHDESEVTALQQKRSALSSRLQEIQEDLKSCSADLVERKAELDALTGKLKTLGNARANLLHRQREIIHQLSDTFGEAEETFVQEMRGEVQNRATQIFLKLTNDSTYTNLQINERFGLRLFRGDQVVTQRSAGAEQVVAFSLIGALNALSAKRGPLILDTPFSRLDSDHRTKILHTLPELGDQVMLLVHDGESTPVDIGATVGDAVGATYEIRRDIENISSTIHRTN